jgi:hypothetical protein
MPETLTHEIPICCLCESPTQTDLQDPELGKLCYDCRNAAAQAEIALQASGLTSSLKKPKNNTKNKS